MSVKGIDVSEYQAKIDWDKVKTDDVNFAILRIGYGMDITSQDDKYIKRNIEECERVGIPFGVYLFSYANTVEKAKSEAEHTLRLIKGHTLKMGVWYDIEDSKTSGAVGKETLTNIINTYCNIIKNSGYNVGIYANLNWLNNKIEKSVQKEYPIWVAQYYKECQYEGDYILWQYTNEGKVNGINGNVDMNYYYEEVENVNKKTNEELAKDVIAGKWGNGEERKNKLEKAGYNYDEVQHLVNKILNTKKSEKIKVGDKVKVKNALQYNNKPFDVYYDKYDVIEVSGYRVVIGIGNTVTCAININNIEKI